MPIKPRSLVWAVFATAITVTPALAGNHTATVGPGTVSEGSFLSASTVTFTAGTGGISTGGRIEIMLPPNWGPSSLQTTVPTANGYVAISSQPVGLTFSIVTSSTEPKVTLTLDSGSMSLSDVVSIAFRNLSIPCVSTLGNFGLWQVRVATSASATSVSIPSPPSQAYSAGTPARIQFVPFTPLTIGNNQISPAMKLQAQNNCGRPVSATGAFSVSLEGRLDNFTSSDTLASFSANSSFSGTIASIAFSTGATETAPFYYRTTRTGNLFILGRYTDPVYGTPANTFRQVQIVAGTYSLGSTSVDHGTAVSGQKSVTITPDGDGSTDSAYIRFTPSDSQVQWKVEISSDSFNSIAFSRFGYGSPSPSISWEGRDMQYNVVNNGNYDVRIMAGNLATDQSLTITVNTAKISGRVILGGSGVPGAMVNAFNANGPGSGSARTESDGSYTVWGLKSGLQYNLVSAFSNNGAAVEGRATNVPAGSSGQDLTIQSLGTIKLQVTISTSATQTSYGSVQIRTADYTRQYYGTLRIQTGNSASDNGDPFNPSSFTVVNVIPGGYVISVQMPGYGTPADQTVTVTAASTSTLSIPLTARATLYGKITLPSPVTQGTFISVDGTLGNASFSTVFGGTYLNSGQSEGIYSIFNVPAGSYKLRARAPGYKVLEIQQTVGSAPIGNSTTGGVDFTGFQTGLKISGTITAEGDTTALGNPFVLWINAFSPSRGQNEFTQVNLTPNATTTSSPYALAGLDNGTYIIYPPYLDGFNFDPPGPQNVTISGADKVLNLTMKQNTGVIATTILLPGSSSDYAQVVYTLNGPGLSRDISVTGGPTFPIANVGTGFYELLAYYKTTGLQKRISIKVVNGQTTSTTVDLSGAVRKIFGAVSIASPFSMKNTNGQPVTISDIPGLRTNAANEQIQIGGQNQTITTARVEAFSKNFGSYGGSNRTGFTNQFALGEFKYGTISADGSYEIDELAPGIYDIAVYPFFDGGTAPNAASVHQTVTVGASNVSGVDFTLTGGNSVSGTLKLPTGVTDARIFNVDIRQSRGDTVQQSVLALGSAANPANSVAFEYKGLTAGSYVLTFRDQGTTDAVTGRVLRKYVAKPYAFKIEGSDISNVQMDLKKSGRIVGKIGMKGKNADGSSSLTLLTSNNVSLLPTNFRITSEAVPWIEGGYEEAVRDYNAGGKLDLTSAGEFQIDGLVSGTYDVQTRQDTFDISTQGQGSVNLAPLTKSGVTVTEGATVDIGTLELEQGLSVSGEIRDTDNHLLPNILVRAEPSNSSRHHEGLEGFTDEKGQFTISGLDPKLKNYDFIAAPRPDLGETRLQPVAFGSVRKRAVSVTSVPPPALSFTLSAANASITGIVQTADHGALSSPDEEGYPGAGIYMHRDGDVTGDDPMGEIRAVSNLDGHFNVGNLVPGDYTITVMSVGYRPRKFTKKLVTTLDLETITLDRGPSARVTLTKPDGSAVTTGDIRQGVAVTSNLDSIIFGQIQSDDATKNITSLTFSGFELSPQKYSILLFGENDDITIPAQGKNLGFAADTDSIELALTYQPTQPTVFTQIQRSGTSVVINYFFTRPVRNRTAFDADPTHFVSIQSGAGTLSDFVLSDDRRNFSVTYAPAANEQSATLTFAAFSPDVDPTTQTEFAITKTTRIRFGQKAEVEKSVSPVLGGTISLSDAANDPSGVTIPANALLNTSGQAADTETTYSVTFAATDDIENAVSASGRPAGLSLAERAPALTKMLERGEEAYHGEAYAAIRAARTTANVNPFSAFYSVLLPAGLNSSLGTAAKLTLQYDNGTDPSKVNVYYFNGDRYLIEKKDRTIDTLNRTITVNVSHFSTFVVLQSAASVIEVDGDAYTGTDIETFNFPNPFDLKSKTKTITKGGTTASITTDGTIIRYAFPTAWAGHTQIDIYNIIGEKVRSIDLGSPAGGQYHYATWDGKNDSGNKIASGVYIAIVKVSDHKKFFKMAVIK